MKTVVTALPGSGKTTTLKKLVEIMPDVRVVNFGDIMFEEAARSYGIVHRDDMRRMLSLPDYQKLQLMAAEKIAVMANVVVDTHSVIKTSSGYYPGLPSEVVKIIKPDLIVYIESRPEDIAERRMRDDLAGAGRKREASTLEEIILDQQVGRQFVVAAANAAMCYLKIISLDYPQTYPFQHAEDAARQIAQAINEVRRSMALKKV
ncbi:MAG: adenylate kinase [Candidatus Caldarchaeum sp.]